AIECVTVEQQVSFVQEIDVDVMRCVKDANRNHVIQKLIEQVSLNFWVLSCRSRGMFTTWPPIHTAAPQTRPLIDKLHKYTTQLMQDQFGNYLIQFVPEHGAPADWDWILHKLQGQMVQMAKHKFTSNVCEKALVTADPGSHWLLIEEIMTPGLDATMCSSFPCKLNKVSYFVAKVKPQLSSMKQYLSAYSKRLASSKS
ncbi:mRNA binding protein puf3, partial [Ceratobasidium sp. 414]